MNLIAPDSAFKESYLEAVRGFQQEGLWWHGETDIGKLEANFENFVTELLNRSGETTFWAIIGDEFAGRISVRHELTPALRIMGWNVGYDVSPKFRNQGVGKEMLRKILPFAKSLGLLEVLITCDDNNFASIKVIENNGGELKEKRMLATDKPLKRYYWILT